MVTGTRRAFLGGLGGGMVVAGVGGTLGGRAAFAGGWPGLDDGELTFGTLEPWVELIQTTRPEKLQGMMVDHLREGMELSALVAAASLANARTFGGQDYTGYHCQMALMPAWELSKLLPAESAPLPVLKVLYRTATRIQEKGGRSGEALHLELPDPQELTRAEGKARLRAAMEKRDLGAAERAFASVARQRPEDAFNDLQNILQESLDVHRVVLAWRSWEVMEVAGDEHAATLMRQCVRFCVDWEKNRVRRGKPEPVLRGLLPELLEEHGLSQGPAGGRRATDEELATLAQLFFAAEKADAARAMAAELKSGLAIEDAGEALTLAANSLLLNDPGRREDETSDKPRGSVHGASVGVHASDSARAWRNIARVTDPMNCAASLIAGAYHTAGQSRRVKSGPFAYRERLDEVRDEEPDELLRQARAAIDGGDQALACATVDRYCEAGGAERPLFDLLLEYALSEDGALHAEKYYRTVCEDYASSRPAFRRRHLLGLARVSASEHGFPAPGYEDARERLGV